jgi:hypothetical protein
MNQDKKGFALLTLVLGAALMASVVVVIMSLQKGAINNLYPISSLYPVASPSPISESTDIDTIEQELETTETGDFELDTNFMQSEASSL